MAKDPRVLLGQRVRALRRAQRVSQEELASRAGVHRTYLGGVERGERNPSLRNITRIAQALGVGPGELFWREPRRRSYDVAEARPKYGFGTRTDSADRRGVAAKKKSR